GAPGGGGGGGRRGRGGAAGAGGGVGGARRPGARGAPRPRRGGSSHPGAWGRSEPGFSRGATAPPGRLEPPGGLGALGARVLEGRHGSAGASRATRGLGGARSPHVDLDRGPEVGPRPRRLERRGGAEYARLVAPA